VGLAGHRFLLRVLVVGEGFHQLYLLAFSVGHDPLAALLEQVYRLAVLLCKGKDMDEYLVVITGRWTGS